MDVRESLSRFGACEPQPETRWTGEAALPPEIARFFVAVGPLGEPTARGHSGVSVPSTGDDFWFPPLSRLWETQAGYRWDGRTGERLPDWPDEWLVVASRGGDPLVYDAGSGEVSLLWHGTGAWEAGGRIRGALMEAVGAVALFGVLVDEAGDDRFTDDFDHDPTWLASTARRLRDDHGAAGVDVHDLLTGF